MLFFNIMRTTIILITILLKFNTVTSQVKEYLTNEQKVGKCGSALPKTNQDCHVYSTEDTYCCYLYLADEFGQLNDSKIKNKFCLNIEIKNYNKLGNINYFNINYRIDCGVASQIFSNSLMLDGLKCGDLNPINPQECFKYSKENNYCCYYKIKKISGCYYLIGTYSGIYVNDEIGEFYECGSFHNNYKYMKNFASIILLIFLFF